MFGLLVAQPLAAADRAAILTVTGDIANTNRAPFDAFRDGLLNAKGLTFERAFQLDEDDLAALPQQELLLDAESWPTPLTISGPKLADVLAAAGGTGKRITIHALDGYAKPMTIEQIASKDWVLANHADGVALGIGGRGPIWLVHSTDSRKATAQEERSWIWSVFHIAVGQ